MRRNISKALVEWKDTPNRKPLVITGVRQCGKTYVMREFGTSCFKDVAYINLERDSLAASVFEMTLEPARIISGLSVVSLGKEIVEGETLLILDEIQACPRALTALKYFCEDMPGLHVVCAGSLLGVALTHENISFPVGKVDRLQMYPMSFDEFLSATRGDGMVEMLAGLFPTSPLPASFASELEAAYRDFLIVGGMPEALLRWVETSDYGQAEAVQGHILADYEADFAKLRLLETWQKSAGFGHRHPNSLPRRTTSSCSRRSRRASAPTSSKTLCNGLWQPGLFIRPSFP